MTNVMTVSINIYIHTFCFSITVFQSAKIGFLISRLKRKIMVMHNIGIMISFIRNFTMQVKMFELFLLHELGTFNTEGICVSISRAI